MTVLGVDIGAHGALALLTGNGDLLDVADMPILRDGPNSPPTVNGALLAAIIRRWAPETAIVEFVGARPGEGPTGAFAFGRSRGVIEGVLASAGIPASFIAPAAWKRTIGMPPGKDGAKDAARSEAIRRWPSKAELFARAKDDGRAEAALIGVAGMLRAERLPRAHA
jgi:crossover junction endodeoxyribonuclease RuvC